MDRDIYPSRELLEHARERLERQLARARVFAAKTTPTWDWWPCDWQREVEECEKALGIVTVTTQERQAS